MTVRVHMIEEGDKKKWNEVVEMCPTSEVFHLYEWGELIQKTYDARIFRLAAEANNKIVGILPFVHFGTPFFGRKIVSLPFADTAGFCTLQQDPDVSRELIRKLIKSAQNFNVDFVEVRSFRENATDLLKAGFTEGFQAFSYRLDTRMPYDTVWMRYNKKIRHNIRKVKESGLKIREARYKSEVDSYYRIYLERMKDFGTPPAPITYWKNMWDIFHPKGMMKLIFTVLDGQPISGFVALLFKRKLYFVLNISLKKHWRYHGLNELLFDWYIKYACENDYDLVDFGRTRKGTGVQRFKEKGWGVERIPLCTYYFFLCGTMRNPLETVLNTEGNLYTKVWRKLVPTSLTPTLGRFVRKRIGDV